MGEKEEIIAEAVEKNRQMMQLKKELREIPGNLREAQLKKEEVAEAQRERDALVSHVRHLDIIDTKELIKKMQMKINATPKNELEVRMERHGI